MGRYDHFACEPSIVVDINSTLLSVFINAFKHITRSHVPHPILINCLGADSAGMGSSTKEFSLDGATEWYHELLRAP